MVRTSFRAPGQFVHVKCGEGLLLRRPISVCSCMEDEPVDTLALAALHMNKLSRCPEGGADHVPRLQHHIDCISHLLLGDDLTFAFYFHDRSPLSLSPCQNRAFSNRPGNRSLLPGDLLFLPGKGMLFPLRRRGGFRTLLLLRPGGVGCVRGLYRAGGAAAHGYYAKKKCD